MTESRERKRKKREEIRRLLAESRSGTIFLTEVPSLERIPDLVRDLDDFIQSGLGWAKEEGWGVEDGFHMEEYRNHILSILSWDNRLFTEIELFIKKYPTGYT